MQEKKNAEKQRKAERKRGRRKEGRKKEATAWSFFSAWCQTDVHRNLTVSETEESARQLSSESDRQTGRQAPATAARFSEGKRGVLF